MQRGWNCSALTLAAMLGVASGALAQGFGFGPPGPGGMLIRMPEVQAELKLTEAQKSKVDALEQQRRAARQGTLEDLQSRGPEAFQKQMAEWQAGEEKQIAAILTPEQLQRYHQLQLQQRGAFALADPPVADSLKLTDEQRTRIHGILDEQRQSMRSMFGGPGGPGGPPPGFGGPGSPPPGTAGPGGLPPDGAGPGGFDPQALRAKMESLRNQTNKTLLEVLTGDQQKQWKEMLGAPFSFPAFLPGGPGPFRPGA